MKTKAFYTAIATDKLDETVRFYCDILGFEVKHTVETKMESHVVVLENGEGGKIDIIETPGIPGRFHALRTNTDDIDAAVAECKEKGCTIIAGPVEIGTGKALIVKDPNGVLIDITQHIRKD